jgi:hypothetical protein
MAAIRQRHDDALEQIGTQLRRAAARTSAHTSAPLEVRINQTVPEFDGAALRPDIQLRDPGAKTLVLADLAVSFEEQPMDQPATSTLQQSRDHKITKYETVAAQLRLKGWRVHVGAIVYGSLGAVPRGNFELYTERLGLLKREARQLDAKLSSHCIRASHRIWRWHCGEHRRRQQSRGGNGTSIARGSGGILQRTSDTAAR